ncbi:S1 family peptidase [Microvirga roseola]|uniref:S1 family peptidase n=1 Tax=Microvirga roseola TaxID=2883126 RepID=UPI001E33D2F9|nr:S1 family peptidase [Microvirga roseola]
MTKRLVALVLAASLSATQAQAIIGGAEDQGPLARRNVMVLNSNGGVCTAVVLARDVVLTAAHCVTGAAEYRVHFRYEAGEPVLIDVTDKAVHPGYDAKAIEKRTRSIDLALVRIPTPLPGRFEEAVLSTARPAKDGRVTVGGYGLAREKEPKTMGTFRSTALTVIEPYGPSRILLWSKGSGATGACQGDSGGPMVSGDAVAAITSWSSSPTKDGKCGGLTQGILVGAQREWIDRVLKGWNRGAKWSGD